MIPPAVITWLFRLAPYLAVAAVVFWVMGMRSDLTELRQDNATLTEAVKAETIARRRDVAGLTTLSVGLTTAAAARTKDQAILERTVDASTAQPVSPALRDLLAGLRANDRGDVPAPAASTGGAAGR